MSDWCNILQESVLRDALKVEEGTVYEHGAQEPEGPFYFRPSDKDDACEQLYYERG